MAYTKHTWVSGDKLTAAQMNEISEELESTQQSIPTKLANPQPLSFTGGVSGTYDGSQAVTINIPEAGVGDAFVVHFSFLGMDPDTGMISFEADKTAQEVIEKYLANKSIYGVYDDFIYSLVDCWSHNEDYVVVFACSSFFMVDEIWVDSSFSTIAMTVEGVLGRKFSWSQKVTEFSVTAKQALSLRKMKGKADDLLSALCYISAEAGEAASGFIAAFDDLLASFCDTSEARSLSVSYDDSTPLPAGTTLSQLKEVVRIEYYDGSTSEPLIRGTDYELSGTLTAGQTNTITVTGLNIFYRLKTLSFDVTVSTLVPSEYQQVEYIASSEASNYFVTDIVPDNDTLVVMKARRTNDNTSFGCGNASTTNGSNFHLTGGAYASGAKPWYTWRYGNGSAAIETPNARTIDVIEFGRRCTQNGTAVEGVATSMAVLPTLTMAIWGRHASASRYDDIATGELYYFKVYGSDDTSPTHNFVPCYRKSDNEVGLYETVNGKFYTNAGSGMFTKGADV